MKSLRILGACASVAVAAAATARDAYAQAAPGDEPAVVHIEATPPAPSQAPASTPPPVPVASPVPPPPPLGEPDALLRVDAAEPMPVTVASLTLGLGPRSVRCTAPCALRVPPGLYQLSGLQSNGRLTVGRALVVPPGTHVRLMRATVPAGGVALAVVGGAAFVTGLGLGFGAIACVPSSGCSFVGLMVASMATGLVGGALAAAGILWVVSGSRGGVEWQRPLAARRGGARWALAPMLGAAGTGAAALLQY